MFFEVANVDNGKKDVHNIDNHFMSFLVQRKYLQQLPIINWLLSTACTYRKRGKKTGINHLNIGNYILRTKVSIQVIFMHIQSDIHYFHWTVSGVFVAVNWIANGMFPLN